LMPDHPAVGVEGTWMQTPEERHKPIGELLQEICMLDIGIINFGDMVYINPADWMREHAKLIKDSGVKPELECFDTGYIRMAHQLMSEGLLEDNPLFQLCLGIPWGDDADAETMIYMRDRLPEKSNWLVIEIGAIIFTVVV